MRRYDGWGCKVRSRKGQGTGRMRHLKSMSRLAKNNFREVNNYVQASSAAKKNAVKSNEKRTLTKKRIPKRRLL